MIDDFEVRKYSLGTLFFVDSFWFGFSTKMYHGQQNWFEKFVPESAIEIMICNSIIAIAIVKPAMTIDLPVLYFGFGFQLV